MRSTLGAPTELFHRTDASHTQKPPLRPTCSGAPASGYGSRDSRAAGRGRLGVRKHDSGVQALYDQLNRRFFGGRLPRYRVVLAERLPRTSWTEPTTMAFCDDKRELIRLRRTVAPTALRRALLHEMCHIGLPYGHGKRFCARLLKLAAHGETWAKWEAASYALCKRSIPATFDALAYDFAVGAFRRHRWRFAGGFPPLSSVVRWCVLPAGMTHDRLRKRAPWLQAAWCSSTRPDRRGAPRHPATGGTDR